jgi:hypothetical protein
MPAAVMAMTDSISLYSTHMYTLRFAIVTMGCLMAALISQIFNIDLAKAAAL